MIDPFKDLGIEEPPDSVAGQASPSASVSQIDPFQTLGIPEPMDVSEMRFDAPVMPADRPINNDYRAVMSQKKSTPNPFEGIQALAGETSDFLHGQSAQFAKDVPHYDPYDPENQARFEKMSLLGQLGSQALFTGGKIATGVPEFLGSLPNTVLNQDPVSAGKEVGGGLVSMVGNMPQQAYKTMTGQDLPDFMMSPEAKEQAMRSLYGSGGSDFFYGGLMAGGGVKGMAKRGESPSIAKQAEITPQMEQGILKDKIQQRIVEPVKSKYNEPKLERPEVTQRVLLEPEKATPSKEPWEMTQKEFNNEYEFHATKPYLIQTIRKEGIKAGSWFSKNAKSTQEFTESGSMSAAERGGQPVFGIRGKDIKDIPASASDIFGQEFQKQKIYRRSGVAHQIEFEIPGLFAKNPHEYLVKKALSEGKSVPESVLKDYPYLRSQTETSKAIQTLELRSTETPPQVPAKQEVKPKEPLVEEARKTAEPDLIGLKKTEIAKIRDELQLEKLSPAKKKSFTKSIEEAVENKYDQEAGSIARQINQSHGRKTASDAEFAGMVIRTRDLSKQYDETMKQISENIDKGKPQPHLATKAELLMGEIDQITRASEMTGTETARALSIRRMMLNKNTYDLTPMIQRAQARKGAKLTPQEQAKFTEIATKHEKVQKELDAYKVKYDKMVEGYEQKLAERVTATQRFQAKKSIAKKEQIIQERESIYKQLEEIGFRRNEAISISGEALYLVGKLGATYIKEGINKLSDVVAKIKGEYPDLSDTDIYRALNTKDPSRVSKYKSDAQNDIQAIKTQARWMLDIENSFKGKSREIQPRPMQKAEIQSLRKFANKVRLSLYKRNDISPQNFSKSLEILNDIQDRLGADYKYIKQTGEVSTIDMVDISAQFKRLNKFLRTEKSITELQEQIKTGEFKRTERPEPIRDPELERLQIELTRIRRQADKAQYDLTPKTIGQIAAIPGNTFRALKATADMSYTLRQGLVLSVRRPKSAAKAFGKAFQATFSKNKADKIDNIIRTHPDYYLAEKSKLFLPDLQGHKMSAREESFFNNLLEKGKYNPIRPIVQASERNMITGLNVLRFEAFKQFLDAYPNATPKEMTAWADAVNVFSGRGNLGKAASIANELGVVFFAPRFALSRIQTPGMFFKYIKEPRVRWEIAKDMAAFGGFAVTTLALAKASGLNVGTDPKSADFGKIVFGNTRVDIFAGMQQFMRPLVASAYGVAEKIGTGKTDVDPLELATRFIQYKLSPQITIPQSLIVGKSLVGEKMTPSDVALRSVIPLVYEDISDAYKDRGLGLAVGTGVGGFLGLNINTYEKRQKSKKKTKIEVIR